MFAVVGLDSPNSPVQASTNPAPGKQPVQRKPASTTERRRSAVPAQHLWTGWDSSQREGNDETEREKERRKAREREAELKMVHGEHRQHRDPHSR